MVGVVRREAVVMCDIAFVTQLGRKGMNSWYILSLTEVNSRYKHIFTTTTWLLVGVKLIYDTKEVPVSKCINEESITKI
jgi:hypothetical protein